MYITHATGSWEQDIPACFYYYCIILEALEKTVGNLRIFDLRLSFKVGTTELYTGEQILTCMQLKKWQKISGAILSQDQELNVFNNPKI